MFKRFFDFFLSIFLIVLFFPLFLVIFLFSFADFRAWPVYSQTRVGLNGAKFFFYKFRTMPLDAEKKGPVISDFNDSRASLFGRFLRKTFLDELPQLFNVLKGDMSFVGPRPERPFFHNGFCRKFPEWKKRILVKPGMTGLAQIKGIGSTNPKKKISLDLEYVKSHSLLLDFKIIILTALIFIRKLVGL